MNPLNSECLRRKTLVVAAFGALTALLAGCGGSNNPVNGGTGRATFSVQWPERTSRLIPVASNSLRVSIVPTAGGNPVGSTLIARPQTTASFDTLPTGTFNVVALAYPNADGSGTAQAGVSQQITIVANQNTSLTVTMNSAITSLSAAAIKSPLDINETTTLSITPRDAQSNAVLVTAQTMQFVSSNTSVASVTASTTSPTQATIRGVGAGTAQITATETESGKSVSVTVTVTGNTSPSLGLANTAWPKFRGNLQNTGVSLYANTNTNPTQVASYSVMGNGGLPAIIRSSPVLGADNSVYIGTWGAKFVRLKPTDLSEIQSFGVGSFIDSSPAIDKQNNVYFGCYDNKLYRANPDGTTTILFTSGDRIVSSPTIDSQNNLYFGSNDGHVYGITRTGTLLWKYPNVTNGLGLFSSSPALSADGTVLYIGCFDGNTYALNVADGSLKWSYTTNATESSPAVGSDGTIYIGATNSKLYALNPNGTLKWSATTGSLIKSSPSVAPNGIVYIGSGDNKLYGFSASSGQQSVAVTLGGPVSSAPVVMADGGIVVGAGDGKLYCINPVGGTIRWTFTPPTVSTTNGPSTPSDVFPIAITPDGTIYFGTQYSGGQGIVYAIK